MASKGTVLVTGLNGYIAARTAEAFLDAGFSVRGTVRSLPSADAIVAALAPRHGGRLEVVAVPDIAADGAFDDAVRGVAAVAHLAAPISLTFTDPEPVLRDAVQGTLTLLRSAAHEASVKHVVLMSSAVAVLSTRDPPYTFTEKDWNEEAEALVAEKGKDAPGPLIYVASKTASERAFWKFGEENHPSFTQSTVNPVFVAGPPLVQPTEPEQVRGTWAWIYKLLTGAMIPTVWPGLSPTWVDVRDVARITVFGVEHPEAADGQRYIAVSAYGPVQAAADVLREAYPDRRGIIDEGTPGEGYRPDYSYPPGLVTDGSKAVRATGKAYIPFDQMVRDTAKSLELLLK